MVFGSSEPSNAFQTTSMSEHTQPSHHCRRLICWCCSLHIVVRTVVILTITNFCCTWIYRVIIVITVKSTATLSEPSQEALMYSHSTKLSPSLSVSLNGRVNAPPRYLKGVLYRRAPDTAGRTASKQRRLLDTDLRTHFVVVDGTQVSPSVSAVTGTITKNV